MVESYKLIKDLIEDTKDSISADIESGEDVYNLDSAISTLVGSALERLTINERLDVVIEVGEENIDEEYFIYTDSVVAHVNTAASACLSSMVYDDPDIQVLDYYSDKPLPVDDESSLKILLESIDALDLLELILEENEEDEIRREGYEDL